MMVCRVCVSLIFIVKSWRASEAGIRAEEENGKKYIRDKIQSATAIKSIQQRHKTIYKVAESIRKTSEEFFDKGIDYLKPLV